MMQTIKNVTVWEDQVIIPTYKVSEPEKSPLFIEKRAYQGSTGKVYPLPVTEKLSDEKADMVYQAVYLENDYLKVMVLPQLGGRIHRAYDKTNNYDFVYYNHVIKPALVGLTGPWISGGIEFNWPQHHRPSTYSPVDYNYSKNPDGSCTIYVSEIDRMYGTKGMACFTLYPDKAYIEIKGQIFNRTDIAQTFLWWANPAVPVNDNTYSVFPPDVNAVMDHGKRAVSTFPIATGEYYKYDYSAGIDISRYQNVKVPTSYMAAHSDFDFIGNYDEGIQAGLLHVADHHISPGKKQWTWGNGDFGLAWDRNLTETDGPYIELMTGVFTDNQPDFTWLKPYEEKTFTQYFMPFKGVGQVKNATKDAMINFYLENGTGIIKLYTTAAFHDAKVTVTSGQKLLFEKIISLSPEHSFQTTFSTDLMDCVGCQASLYDGMGNILVHYQCADKELEPTPSPAEPLLSPAQLKSTEELYLAAIHLEQYRHATREPADYYLEGLKRDSTDIRLNNGYGLLQLKRGNFKEAAAHFRTAIQKQTWKNPNPYHGESYFNLGLALEAAGREDAAFDAFYKSTWSHETQSCGFYQLACLATRRGAYTEAFDYVEKSLIRNWHNMKARTLKAALMRIQVRNNTPLLSESLAIDPLYMGCLYESALARADRSSWKRTMRDDCNNYLELSLDYMKCGLYENALDILNSSSAKNPLIYYYQGYSYYKMGDLEKASQLMQQGEDTNPDYCFPNKMEEVNLLLTAIHLLNKAPFANYYLGCLLYDKKQYQKAILHWERSVRQNPDYGMTYRNLAIAYYNKQRDSQKALTNMKKALVLEPGNCRFLLEYDQLSSKTGTENQERLDLLSANLELVKTRDALYVEYITLLNHTGSYGKALESLSSHRFHPWEGGEGRVSSQYRYALTQMAIGLLDQGDSKGAVELLESTIIYPENLGEGKLPNVQDTIAYYYMGKAYQAMNDTCNSSIYFNKAAIGLDAPSSVLYYNDQPSDTILYQGLANEELGNKNAAKKAYHQLLSFGEKHLFDNVDYDYFAVSLPEIEVFPSDIQMRNTIYCKYLMALGYIGLGKLEKADSILDEILAVQPGYQGAIQHKRMIYQSLGIAMQNADNRIFNVD